MAQVKKNALAFAFGVFIFSLIQVVSDIYLFDQYDRLLGRGVSFQISMGIIFGYSVIAALGFGLGLKKFFVLLNELRSAIAGTIFAFVFPVFVTLLKLLPVDSAVHAALILAILFCGAFVWPMVLGRFPSFTRVHKESTKQ